MRKKRKQPLRVATNLLLWLIGLFFLLGGIAYFEKSIVAALAMIILSLFLIPLTWRKIYSLSPKHAGRVTRTFVVLVVFIIAMGAVPSESLSSQSKANVAESNAPQEKVPSPSPSQLPSVTTKLTDKKEGMSSLAADSDSYALKGTGAANTEYIVEVQNSQSLKAKTDNNGNFKVTLPKDAPIFGSIELLKDTNGWWFGGVNSIAKQHYYLDKKQTQFSNKALKPILFGIGGVSTYDVSGSYTPGSTLVIKSDNKDLAQTKVDKSGRFKFENISLSSNFSPMAVYEKVSTGWFSSRDEHLIGGKYLDYQSRRILSELPVYTKEITVLQSIPFASQSVENGSLAKGESKVTQEGINGSKNIVYTVTYKGNQETARQQKAETITKQPISKVTTVGTYVYVPPKPSAPKVTMPSCPNGTYVNSAGNTVCSPYASSSAPSGATAKCGDGTYSFSQSRRGTCSRHGGVSVWY